MKAIPKYCPRHWSAEERLKAYSFVCPTTKCWRWLGGKQKFGHGNIGYKGRAYLAHRLSYETFVGNIPKGAFVLHKCHQPSCINPEHLKTGSQQDNMDDKVLAARQVVGENINNARLTEQTVLEIRRLYKVGASQPELAARFGVHQTNIHYIVCNKTWKHLLEKGDQL